MPFDDVMAARIRARLAGMPGLVEKKMFGGVCFILNGNMACGVHKQSMIVRVGLNEHEAALKRPHTRIFDLTGKPMSGWVMVDAPGVEVEADLADWVERGLAFAATLPPK
jgi:hypothetical protein